MAVVKSMIFDRIEERLNVLQVMLESQEHLTDPDRVEAQIRSVSLYWSILSDDDKDYIDCARWAIEKQSKWNV